MSLPTVEIVTCPKCNHEQEFAVWASLNVSNDPLLKKQFLSGELNKCVCKECGHEAMVEHPVLYHDMEKKLLVWLSSNEEPPSADFDPSLPSMKDFLEGNHLRLVRNRNELIEKILIFDAGLDDRYVEFIKLVLMAQMGKQGQEIQGMLFAEIIGEGTDKSMGFILAGEEGNGLTIPWSSYEELASQHADIFPDRSAEAGKWLRVDLEYANSLNW